MVAAVEATARGLPSMPCSTAPGSDVVRHNPSLGVYEDPPTGTPTVFATALAIDIALIHAPAADAHGNIYVDGDLGLDGLLSPRRADHDRLLRTAGCRRSSACGDFPAMDRRGRAGGRRVLADRMPPRRPRGPWGRRRMGGVKGPITENVGERLVSMFGDLFTTVLAREFAAAAADDGVRVIAVTTTASLVAALAARRLGAADLAIAPGFGTLDGAPRPALSLGERALRAGASPRGPVSDTFVAVARGLMGVVVTPAQLDSRGATNLSHIAGTHAAPRVALPGSRGLPDNNDSPSRVWYLVPDHAARTLVDRVDFVSGTSALPAADPQAHYPARRVHALIRTTGGRPIVSSPTSGRLTSRHPEGSPYGWPPVSRPLPTRHGPSLMRLPRWIPTTCGRSSSTEPTAPGAPNGLLPGSARAFESTRRNEPAPWPPREGPIVS